MDLSLNLCHTCLSICLLVLESITTITLEIVENEAIVLNKSIKEANGEACPELAEAFQRRETLNLECLQQHQHLEEINEAISNAEDVLQSFLNETSPFHQKEGRRYQVHSN